MKTKIKLITVAAVLAALLLLCWLLAGCSCNTGPELSVKAAPTKTEYYVGDTVDLTGGVLLYGTSEVSMTAEGVTVEYDTAAASDASVVTLTYIGKTAAFNIKVIGIAHLTVAMTPEKPAVLVGGQPDYTGGTLGVTYADGFYREVPMDAPGVTKSDLNSGTVNYDGERVDITYYGAETYCYFGVAQSIDEDDLFDEALDCDFENDEDDWDKIPYFYFTYWAIKDSIEEESEEAKEFIYQFNAVILEYYITRVMTLLSSTLPVSNQNSVERLEYTLKTLYCRTVPREFFAEVFDSFVLATMLDNIVNNFDFQRECADYVLEGTVSPPKAFAEKIIGAAFDFDTIGYMGLLLYFNSVDVMAKMVEAVYPGCGNAYKNYFDKCDELEDMDEGAPGYAAAYIEKYEELAAEYRALPQGVIDLLLKSLDVHAEKEYLELKGKAGDASCAALDTLLDRIDDKAENIGEYYERIAAAEAAYNAVTGSVKEYLFCIKHALKEVPLFLDKLVSNNVILLFETEEDVPDLSGISYADIISVGRILGTKLFV